MKKLNKGLIEKIKSGLDRSGSFFDHDRDRDEFFSIRI